MRLQRAGEGRGDVLCLATGGYTFHYPCINLLGSLSLILYPVHNSNLGGSFYFSIMVSLLGSVVAGECAG